MLTPSNSFLWIPSLHTVLAGDIVFNEVHPWLGASDSASRQAWHRSLQRIATFKPDSVVAGHKRDPASPDTPEAVFAMDHYLTDFDALRATSSTGPELAKAMMAKYPGYAVPGLLFYAAQMAYQKKSP